MGMIATGGQAIECTINYCCSCKVSIENCLRQLEPPPISVSFTDRRVSVVHPSDLTSAEILRQVRSLGFSVGGDLPLISS